MLVVTRQGMLDTLESLVAGLAARRQERSEMAEPTAVVWDPTYSVLIKPKQINAPNIERIVLQRNGIVIPPEISTLQPSIQVTAMNAKAIINEGSVIFPASAFEPAPNLSLKLIAIPAVGDNIIHVFTNRELHSIR